MSCFFMTWLKILTVKAAVDKNMDRQRHFIMRFEVFWAKRDMSVVDLKKKEKKKGSQVCMVYGEFFSCQQYWIGFCSSRVKLCTLGSHFFDILWHDPHLIKKKYICIFENFILDRIVHSYKLLNFQDRNIYFVLFTQKSYATCRALFAFCGQ